MTALLLLATTVALAGPKKADKKDPADKPVAYDPSDKAPFTTWGEGRLIGDLPPDLQVNTDGEMVGQDFHLDSRLRAGLAAGTETWRFSTEWDLFEGQLAGDPWDLGAAPDERERGTMGVARVGSFDVRRAAVNGRIGPVGLQAGVMTSHWGLGMVANDGAHDPFFGRNDFGDRVLRLQLGTRPFDGGKLPLYIILAGDRVIEDEIGHWTPFGGGVAPVSEDPEGTGQVGYNAIVSVLWNDKRQNNKAGLYGVYRHQTEADGERVTSAFIMDGYWDWTFGDDDLEVRAAVEGATILGQTDRAQTYTAKEGVKVRSGGLTGLVGIDIDDIPVAGLLRGGWASGDGNPDDDTLHDFSFDRDFDVGMVMFDEVYGSIDAGTYTQLNNPEHSGGPPEGIDGLVSEGAAKHVLFVQPVVELEATEWLQLRAGYLPAWSTRPIAHPFTTYRNGGVAVNHLGTQTTGYFLGNELDWAILVGDEPVTDAKLRPALLIQGGHYFASPDMGGETHTKLMAEGRLRW